MSSLPRLKGALALVSASYHLGSTRRCSCDAADCGTHPHAWGEGIPVIAPRLFRVIDEGAGAGLAVGTLLRAEELYCQFWDFYGIYEFFWVFVGLDGPAVASRYHAYVTADVSGLWGTTLGPWAYPPSIAPVTSVE